MECEVPFSFPSLKICLRGKKVSKVGLGKNVSHFQLLLTQAGMAHYVASANEFPIPLKAGQTTLGFSKVQVIVLFEV